MNVEVDKDLCIGCGFCASTMPSVFELDDDGLSQVIKKENEEENLEDIGFKEKSEARVLIEKFVEEKPEAVASLLRNWLNEDWE